MPNAFYRNTSSSAKKNGERERRQNAPMPHDEVAEQSADVPVSEAAPGKRGRAEQAECPEPRSERSLLVWNVDITPSALVTMSVLGALLLAFTFLSGIIVGRGTMPLPQAQELEKLAPENTTDMVDVGDKILSQEELRFMTSLKAREAEGVLTAAREKETAKKPARPEKTKASRAAESAKKSARTEEAKKPERTDEKKDVRPAVFDYVIRVAAFKEVAPAQKLAQRLAAEGMKPYRHQARSNTGLWNYVSVFMRGTVEDLQVMRRKLDKFGLRDAMVISKKAVKEVKESRGGKTR